MVELGYDMRGHRSKNLREFMGYIHSRYVITVCGQADASCPRGLWSSGEKLYWPFDDPAAFQESDEEKLAYFRKFVTRSRLKSSLGWKRSKLSPSLTDNSQLRPPELLGLLAHPIRWRLVKALTVSDRRVQELVETLAQPYNLVSYHLKLLRQAEIVELRKSDADSRDLYYSVNMNKLQEGYQNVARAIHPAWDLKEAGQAPGRSGICAHSGDTTPATTCVSSHRSGSNDRRLCR